MSDMRVGALSEAARAIPVEYKNAVAEAKRFIARFEEYGEELERRANKGQSLWSGYPIPERAALKRASMDLTRALAKMRACA